MARSKSPRSYVIRYIEQDDEDIILYEPTTPARAKAIIAMAESVSTWGAHESHRYAKGYRTRCRAHRRTAGSRPLPFKPCRGLRRNVWLNTSSHIVSILVTRCVV